jgi:5-formyltetrahydrofolate cyclo-ligase
MASSARDDARDAKRAMRRDAREKLKSMTVDAVRDADAAIARRLGAVRAVATARRVGAYLASERLRECSMATYIDDAAVRGATDDVMVFVPIVDDAGSSSMRMLHVRDVEADATRGAYDLAEPRETYADGSRRLDAVRDIAKVGALDVVVVPGVAFGEDGRRLGRGGGYYDAFLTRYADEAARVGATPPLVVALAYGCQVYPPGAVPVDAHDKLVDIIVTETRTIACTDRGVAAAS